MRKPTIIKDWLCTEDLAHWVRDAGDPGVLRQRLAVWLTRIGPYHAGEVADLLQVSAPAVWKWVGQYNQHGPDCFAPSRRGGRRWGFLSLEKEAALLAHLEERAARGELLTARELLPLVEKTAGRKVSMAYVYRLLARHQWRNLTPPARESARSPSRPAVRREGRELSRTNE